MAEQKIKLAEKQLAHLQQLLGQKAQLQGALQELNQKETMLLEVILEINQIPTPIASAKLEDGFLVIQTIEKTEKKKKVKEQPE